ncbi:hypothetical protein Veis_3842 [Verminephrobacter eiseniae EF01-2]|uniref:Uncharacterized protein n=1 Tax=Verminephrobacter eiseniae (strain EF01-2) TaxID=391735 RepID=A1WPJ4_VEREI|nr:hypothetical protein Veis_3842 [Verminephrobacter eiseniae EF01-2]
MILSGCDRALRPASGHGRIGGAMGDAAPWSATSPCAGRGPVGRVRNCTHGQPASQQAVPLHRTMGVTTESLRVFRFSEGGRLPYASHGGGFAARVR